MILMQIKHILLFNNSMKTFIHDTAIVDEGAQIGSGAEYGTLHVSPGAKIGANVFWVKMYM